MKSALKIMLYSLLFLTASCKRSPQEQEETPPPVPEHSGKDFIPIKFESENLIISLKYRENSSELTEISGSDGYTTAITYKNQQPYVFSKSKSKNRFETVDYVWDKQGVPKARIFDDNGTVNIHKGSYVLTYNESGLSKILSYNSGGALLRETVFRYTAGNLTEKTILDLPEQQQHIVYSYDSKNGIFKHLKYAERLFLESRYSFFADGTNNRLGSTNAKFPQENITYSYQYNGEGYPAELSFTDSRGKQTFKITYMDLKP